MRRLFTPRWILVHLGVTLLVFVMINLGFWQLRRLDEKKTFNARVTAQIAAPVSDYTHGIPTSLAPEWSRVQLAGHYDETHAITIINRSQDGSAGYDIAVPFINDDGSMILVNRGFVPLAVKHPATPPGSIRIVGYLRKTQSRSAVGAIDSTAPGNTEFQRFDLPLIAKATDKSLLNTMYLQLIKESVSSQTKWPATVAMPTLDEGPHLSYAVQWFFFSATALTAWVLVVRRKLRESASGPSAPVQTSV
jgi:cytochrome oxidase assembly protein ShyY1